MRMGDVLTDLLGTGYSSGDYSIPVSGASSGPSYVDNSQAPSASGSGIMSDISNTVINALKAVAGYNLAQDQIEVQKITAQRGGYTYAQPATTRSIVQVGASNIAPVLLVGGVALAAWMMLKR